MIQEILEDRRETDAFVADLLHTERYAIDWLRNPGERPVMLSWSVRSCACDRPWSHY